MTVSINLINTAAENFASMFGKLNQCINAISNNCVTVNATANGSYSTGNGFVVGIFGANTLVATTIRGGNVQGSSTLAITANTLALNNTVSIGNSTVNVTANSTAIIAALVNTSSNSTVGFVANSTAIRLNGKNYSNLDSHIVVANNGATIGDRPKINFVGSGDTSITCVDEAGNSQVTITISSSGGGGSSPGGSNTHVQFNDSGGLGGTDGLTFDKATNNATVANTLTVTNKVVTGQVDLGFGQLTAFASNVATTSAVVLDSFTLASYRAGEYLISIKDNTANNFQVTKILLLQDNTEAYITEYGQMYNNNVVASFSANANATHFKLNYTATTNDTTVRIYRQLIGIAG